MFVVTNEQSVWLASICSLSSIIGCTTIPLIINQIGRRYTCLIFSVSHLMSWILINVAYDYTFLFIARFFAGISVGGTITSIPPYIGEITAKKIRGKFLAFVRICVNFGGFLITTLGAFLTYKTMNLLMISIPILAICLLPFMLESPYYYLKKGQNEDAIKTLMKLYDTKNSEMIITDIERMKKAIDSENSEKSRILELIFDRGSRKAFIILLLVNFAFAFSGTMAIQAYAQVIFKQSGSSLAPEYAAMIVVGVQILACLPSALLVDNWGRRPIYLFSGIMCAISLGIVGLFFFLKEFLQSDVSSVTWVPLLGLVFYQFVCTIGISTIPTVYEGELFTVKVKELAIMTASIILAVFMFTSKMMIPLVNNSVGMYTTFWIFSGICIVIPLIIFYITPETKGRNLEDVLMLMRGKKHEQINSHSC